MTDFAQTLRHYCRNPRCRSKLKEPGVANPHKAFCCRGCYNSFYLKRCLGCEKEKPAGSPSNRLLCRRPKCKADFRRNRSFYLFWSPPTFSAPDCKEVPVNRGSPMALGAIEPSSPFGVQGGRGWHFEPTATGYRLLDRDGQERVSLGLRRSEEDIYAIVKPWTFPRQTAPTLAAALELAKRIAMASLSLDPGAAAYQERCNDRKRIEAEERPRSKAAADYEASFKDEAARGCEFNIEEQTRLAGLLKEIPDDLAIPAFLGR